MSQAKNPDTGQLDTLHVQGNVHLLAGGGGNVVVQVGSVGRDHGRCEVGGADRSHARRDQAS